MVIILRSTGHNSSQFVGQSKKDIRRKASVAIARKDTLSVWKQPETQGKQAISRARPATFRKHVYRLLIHASE
jgi:hypothetical protein